eukprot:TRINITY_DN14141_c1_g1_i2.p1 TRINITY_DN14141_c1_g1~~TRINITY_DN14141_c1_g1_i2.p1  ORF type:complete len:190 (-),score=17.89 TRINITY_DN14141_c1_g1_i2:147-716(-)
MSGSSDDGSCSSSFPVNLRQGLEQLIKSGEGFEVGLETCEDFQQASTSQDLEQQRLCDILSQLIQKPEFLDKLQEVQHRRQSEKQLVADASMDSDFVVVGKQEVVSAMASYIAEFLYLQPESRELEPKQLQKALSKTIREVRDYKQGYVWALRQNISKGMSMTYNAVKCYEPWLVDAVQTLIQQLTSRP